MVSRGALLVTLLKGGGVLVPAPDAATAGQWTATAGDQLIAFHINTVPSLNGGTLAGWDISLDGGLTKYGSVGVVTDWDVITLTNGVGYDTRIRPVTQYVWPDDTTGWSDTKTRTPSVGDVTAPTITSASSANNVENTVLAHALTADEAVTWSIVSGADQARFEISGSTLRWVSNGTKNYEAPDDADTNNTYVVGVRATDGATNTTDQTITITVTDAYEEVGVAFDGTNDYLRGNFTLTGAADAKTALIFFSVDCTNAAPGGEEVILARLGNAGKVRHLATTGAISVQWNNTTPTLIISMSSSTTGISGRCNGLVSLDADGTSRLWLWLAGTGVWASEATDAAGGGVNLDFTDTGNVIGARDNGSLKFVGSMYRVAMWDGITLPDITDAAVRAKFADATTGVTVDPAVSVADYGTPILDFYGPAATWNNASGNNHGSGGPFAVNGAVV